MAVFRAPITPGMRWAAGNGTDTPAAGYLLFQYQAGGATPEATFTDSTGGTPNANPIVLDANGGLEAAGPGGTAIDLWFTGGLAYRLLLTDASAAPLPGNPVWDKDDLVGVDDPAFASPSTGEWITGPAATWISSAAAQAGTVFSLVGDQRALFQPNRRVRVVSGTGDLVGTVSSSTYAANLTTVTVDMQRTLAGAIPTVADPITAVYYAVENTGALTGLPAGMPSRVLELGAPRWPSDGTARTDIDLYGPIGSNLVAFTVPPNVVAAGGGAGDQQVTGVVNGVAGSLTFNKTAHARTTGQPIQLTVNAPPNTALATTYIVFVVDANNFGLYAVPAGWTFRQPYLDPLTNPGGLAWGNPIAFGGAAAGATTVTPGFVAPPGVTRVWQEVTGASSGSGGSRGSTGNGGFGGNGDDSTFNGFTGNFGAPGAGGLNTSGGDGGSGGAASGGAISIRGGKGVYGDFNTASGSRGGPGGGSRFCAGGTTPASRGNGGGMTGANSLAANQGGGGGSGGGGTAIGFAVVVPGTFYAAKVGIRGTGGAAGTGTNSAAGDDGSDGIIVVWW